LVPKLGFHLREEEGIWLFKVQRSKEERKIPKEEIGRGIILGVVN